MIAVVAVDRNWGIGKNNELLVKIPDDMKRFHEQTDGKVVVMGRRTLESLPSGQPLKDRVNVVLSRNEFDAGGAIVVHSVEELLEEIKGYDPEDVFCIGGGSIYEQLLPYCDKVLVTKIDHGFDADTFFPNLENMPEWDRKEESDIFVCNGLKYKFLRYEKCLK